MATVNSREIVDAIIAGKGQYEDDERVLKIVQYNNMFDGKLAYGLVYASDGPAGYDRYEGSPACLNPRVIFENGEPVTDDATRCDFCGAPAEYDFKTKMGPWANGCEVCWEAYRQYPDLGTGKGARLQ